MFSDEEITVKELNIPKVCDQIKIECDNEIKLEKDILKEGIFYFSQKYSGVNVIIKEGENIITSKLTDSLNLKQLDKERIKDKLNEILKEIKKKF